MATPMLSSPHPCTHAGAQHAGRWRVSHSGHTATQRSAACWRGHTPLPPPHWRWITQSLAACPRPPCLGTRSSHAPQQHRTRVSDATSSHCTGSGSPPCRGPHCSRPAATPPRAGGPPACSSTWHACVCSRRRGAGQGVRLEAVLAQRPCSSQTLHCGTRPAGPPQQACGRDRSSPPGLPARALRAQSAPPPPASASFSHVQRQLAHAVGRVPLPLVPLVALQHEVSRNNSVRQQQELCAPLAGAPCRDAGDGQRAGAWGLADAGGPPQRQPASTIWRTGVAYNPEPPHLQVVKLQLVGYRYRGHVDYPLATRRGAHRRGKLSLYVELFWFPRCQGWPLARGLGRITASSAAAARQQPKARPRPRPHVVRGR